ncbi:hypothetical protein JB92DRAFT_3145494 [Gautieria morchelliformis]|nr:hypothetical protein JB92DRAFT_3145494 [Gautieria morchelliformis]
MPQSARAFDTDMSTSLSGSAVIGLAVCPILFFLLIAGFILVARKRELSCFRPSDIEIQRRQTVEDHMGRLSAANASRIRKEDLSEVFTDEHDLDAPYRGHSPGLSEASTTVPSLPANSNTVPTTVTIPLPAYIPKA